MTSALSFAVVQDETSWGTLPVSPVSRYVPLTLCDLEAEIETREQTPVCGVLQTHHVERLRRSVRGRIALPLYGFFQSGDTKSFAQQFVEWAFSDPDEPERDSKTLHWIDAASASQWSGLRVEEATLSGDASGISLTLSVVGKDESESALVATLPVSRGKLSEFLFSDVSLELDGNALAIESFQWSVKYLQSLKFNDGYTPSSLRCGGAQQTLTIKPLKADGAYMALQRLQSVFECDATLVLQGRHEGTGASGTHTKCELDFSRLALGQRADAFGAEDYLFEPLVFRVLKPQSSATAVQQAWALV